MKKSYYLSVLILMGLSPLIQAQIDYSTQIEPIFHSNCLSCHNPRSGLDVTSYSTLLSSIGTQYGSNLIVSGDPDASGIVDKIENVNPSFGSRMPNSNGLPSADVAMIRQWISEGASEIPTSNEVDTQLPNTFRLIGNYPNPFNPSTQIQFELPVSAQFTISIFSVHGQLLMEEVGFANAGVASISVDMQNNPTGVYLYQVSAVVNGQTNMIGTGRMTLIK